ncbi:unnamed protein product [Trichobilharzia regenti]|nr:unnamed protein product [Trichobilharzia regenti]
MDPIDPNNKDKYNAPNNTNKGSRTTSEHQPPDENKSLEGNQHAKNWRSNRTRWNPSRGIENGPRGISKLDDTTTGEGVEREQGTRGLEEGLLIQIVKVRRLKPMQEYTRRCAPVYPKQNTKPHHPGESQTRPPP